MSTDEEKVAKVLIGANLDEEELRALLYEHAAWLADMLDGTERMHPQAQRVYLEQAMWELNRIAAMLMSKIGENLRKVNAYEGANEHE